MSTIKAWLTPFSKEEREALGIQSFARYCYKLGGIKWSGRTAQIRENLSKIDSTATVEIKKHNGYPSLFFLTNKEVAIASSELITFRVVSENENLSKIERKTLQEEKNIKTLLSELPIKAKAWRLANKANTGPTINYNILDGVELFDYQKEAVKNIIANKQFVLCAEPGTGKTITSIASAMNVAQPGDKILVVVPNPGLVTQFAKDCQRFGIKTKTDWKKKTLSVFSLAQKEVVFHIIPATKLNKIVDFTKSIKNGKITNNKSKVRALGGELSEITSTKYKMVIVDEVHLFKNVDNNRSPLMKGLMEIVRTNGCERFLPMTGTPMVTRVGDFFGIYNHILSHPIGGIDIKDFNNIASFANDSLDGNEILKEVMGIKTYKHGEGVDSNGITMMYVPKNTGVKINIQFVPIKASAKLITDVKKAIDNSKMVQVGDKTINTALQTILGLFAKHKESTIAEKLISEKEPVVVMSNSTNGILVPLSQKVNAGLLIGSVSEKKREEHLKDFIDGKVEHLLCNKVVASTGRNGMQYRSKKMYLCEIGWELGNAIQAMGRLDRADNKFMEVDYIIFYVEGFDLNGKRIEFEENIISSMRDRAEIMTQYLQGNVSEELRLSMANQEANSRNVLRELLTKS